MTHYDVLGVSRSADVATLRRAYLGLVRDHHPDRHAGSPPAVRAASEDRMRALNEAWRELGDPERRRRYDELLDRRPRGAVIEPDDERSWRPYDGGEDDAPDDRLDDSLRPQPRGGRLLTMGAPMVLSVGVSFLVLGFVLSARGLLALGAMGVILGGALFVLAPMNVIMESRQNDLH